MTVNLENDDTLSVVPWTSRSPVPQAFFTAAKGCNPHEYKYLINQPHACSYQRNIFLLIMVKSSPNHKDRRDAIRETWAQKNKISDSFVKVVFLLGSRIGVKLQGLIIKESNRRKDIIQEDFHDSVQNLTLKAVMGFKWAYTYCSNAKFVMLMTDDAVVDIYKLIPYLQPMMSSIEYQSHFTLCYLFPCCTKVHRDIDHVYAISSDLYNSTAYPAYCSGVGYVAPFAVIRRLYLMSLDTPSFSPANPWVGVLAHKLGLQFLDTYTYFSGVANHPTLIKSMIAKDYLRSPLMVGVVGYDHRGNEAELIRDLWYTISKRHKDKMNDLSGDTSHNATSWYLLYSVIVVIPIITMCVCNKRKLRKYCCCLQCVI